jgi:hypothetical protein
LCPERKDFALFPFPLRSFFSVDKGKREAFSGMLSAACVAIPRHFIPTIKVFLLSSYRTQYYSIVKSFYVENNYISGTLKMLVMPV